MPLNENRQRFDPHAEKPAVPSFAKLPRHLAIIMDGNGRWAAQRRRPRVFGHRRGMERAKDIVRACGDLLLESLTLYAFSLDNWNRPKSEVNTLMRLLVKFLKSELEEMMESNIRFRVLGRREMLPEFVMDAVREDEVTTAANTGLNLNLAVSYGGRAEIVDAVNAVRREMAAGIIEERPITEELIAKRLYTAGQPEVDLLVRTSGELRVSDFLLWQIAYAEIYVTEAYWPDFSREELYRALEAYAGRERRFGRLGKQMREPNG
ncbi:MAG: isoprenyl transferase [Candidatus Coatesbacteria bacterium]|nr:isoprenyl transferase [Candidatus Coatesbacteria bacterium]